MRIPVKVTVLEINSRRSKDQTKTYHNLICYQPGCKFPQLISASIDPAEMDLAASLVGEQEVTVELEQFTFSGQNRYAFLGVA